MIDSIISKIGAWKLCTLDRNLSFVSIIEKFLPILFIGIFEKSDD